MLALLGLAVALLDMGMNGARYATWAWWGLVLVLLGVVLP